MNKKAPCRRLGFVGLLLLQATVAATLARGEERPFAGLERQPAAVLVITETATNTLAATQTGLWVDGSLRLTTKRQGGPLFVQLSAPEAEVKSLEMRWDDPAAAGVKYLGDAWERAYGDLEWRTLDARRVMPWYFLASDGQRTAGYGVKTGAAALCYWTVDERGITLHADVRCGGKGVRLGRRTLEVCSVVSRAGELGESPFAAARAFCAVMCPRPRLPQGPVYGFNDWYCTYGHDTAENFLANVNYLVSLEPQRGPQPFAVADDGWQWAGGQEQSPGLWNQTNPHFSATLSMAEFARKIKAAGARPGLWYRPLIANADAPVTWRLQRDSSILDPTVPEVRALIRTTMKRFHGWGYELVKHDYTTYDICGRWGKDMGAEVTPDGWAFADRSKTTAEVIRDLYADIRAGAGSSTIILGCNTMGHLAAGIFEMQRIGDDTSGRDWNRTRDMGVNCLAFRAPQNGTFFAVDGDCAGQVASNSVPWVKNSQWLDLLARSGTPLFVSFPYQTINPDQEHALRTALQEAAHPQPLGEPLDWQQSRTPARWRLDDRVTDFNW